MSCKPSDSASDPDVKRSDDGILQAVSHGVAATVSVKGR
jgi:hypothetical protein